MCAVVKIQYCSNLDLQNYILMGHLGKDEQLLSEWTLVGGHHAVIVL